MSRTYKDAPRHVKLMRDFKQNRVVEHDHENIGREIYRNKAMFIEGHRVDEETFNIGTAKGVAEFEKYKIFLQSHSIGYIVHKRLWFDYSDYSYVTVEPLSYEFVYEYEDHCTENEIPSMFKSKFSLDGILENGKFAPCTPEYSVFENKKDRYYRCNGYCPYWTYSGRAKTKAFINNMMKAHYAGISTEDLIDFTDFTDDDKAHSCWC